MKNPRRVAFILIAGGLSLVLIWFGISAFRVWRAAGSLASRQAQVEELLGGGLMQVDAGEAEAVVLGIRSDAVELSAAAGPFVPLAPLFEWLPRFGPALAVAPELMEIADAGTEAAVFAMQGIRPILPLLQDDSANDVLPQAVRLLDSASKDLAASSLALGRVAQARSEIQNTGELPWRVQTLLVQIDKALPLARDGLSLATVLPDLMGLSGRRTYLIVAQNEDELRPTGGFISGAGLLHLNEGEVESLSFLSSDAVDDWLNKPYDLPPQPFQDFMGMDIFLFRDTNFWSDFPTSAEQMMESYSHGQEVELDGVIAVDQRFLSKLLEVTGPLNVPELAATLSSANVISELRAAWEPTDDETDWIANRKSFMGPLATALFQQLTSSPGSVDMVRLARVMAEAAEQRHFQAYVRDPAVQNALVEAGWAGRQANEAGQDFLLVTDTNMGFNKVNASVERSLDYKVHLSEEKGGRATLTIEYSYNSEPSGKSCLPFAAVYSTDIRYGDLIEDCYWNYVRVHAPAGSELVDASRHPIPGEALLAGEDWDGQATASSDPATGLAEFSNFVLVPHGGRATVTFTYNLPATVIHSVDGTDTYYLAVNKQAGLDAQHLTVTVELPPGRRLLGSAPSPTSIEDSTISFEAVQRTDHSFSIEYK